MSLDKAKICEVAAASPLRRYSWHGRGGAPSGYIKGLAVAFAQCYVDLKAGDSAAKEMARPIGDGSHDVLAWYEDELRAHDMMDSTPSDILRHLFVIMYGLGMRESSGTYSEGRDMSVSNFTADSAEAGMFQQSWDSSFGETEIPKLLQRYSSDPHPDCLLDVFREGVSKPISASVGSGHGLDFQRLAKSCPMFAVACAAVGLRNLRRHWGPINRKEAEVRSEANNLLLQVQQMVDSPVASPQPEPAPAPVPGPVVEPEPPPAPVTLLSKQKWPTQSECDSFYGNPRAGSAWENANLVPFVPPWQMIDEDSKRPVHTFKVHKKVQGSLARVLLSVWSFYGRSQATIESHHMHLFSGSYVFRNIRGGNRLSMHSYGIAIDIAAGLNELGAPYNPIRGLPMPLIEAFEAEGWTWGGRWHGRPDAMHFQAALVA